MKIVDLIDYPEYIDIVVNWIYSEFIQNTKINISKENVKGFFTKRYKNKMPITYIAVKKNQCLGTVSLVGNDLKERKDLTPWLAALYVVPQNRKKGIAKILINEVVNKAKDFNYTKIYLRTEEAAQYYKQLGWKNIYKTIDEYNQSTEVFTKEIAV